MLSAGGIETMKKVISIGAGIIMLLLMVMSATATTCYWETREANIENPLVSFPDANRDWRTYPVWDLTGARKVMQRYSILEIKTNAERDKVTIKVEKRGNVNSTKYLEQRKVFEMIGCDLKEIKCLNGGCSKSNECRGLVYKVPVSDGENCIYWNGNKVFCLPKIKWETKCKSKHAWGDAARDIMKNESITDDQVEDCIRKDCLNVMP